MRATIRPIKSRNGFTIVELLIVTVVIAILAVISIVAYNGIQQRADTSAVQASISQLEKSLELIKIEKDGYPSSISDCPTPAAGAACLKVGDNLTATYERLLSGARPSPVIAGSTLQPSYELTIKSNKSMVYKSTAERTGTNEFLQYMDMAPIINQYGLRPYQITFDIKSANTSSVSAVSVYMQNGSGAKYSFNTSVPVTTSYAHRTITVIPEIWQNGIANSVLAFYGSYSTGNIPSVKNVEITLAN